MLEEREGRKLPLKTIWVTYGLQSLSTEKFLKTVQKILNGKLTLLKPAEELGEDLRPEMEISTEPERRLPERRKAEPVGCSREDEFSSVLV
jgi:hypothetical protein